MGLLSRENLSQIKFNDGLTGLTKVHLYFNDGFSSGASHICITVYDRIPIEKAVSIEGDLFHNGMKFVDNIANEIRSICTTILGEANIELFDDEKRKEFSVKYGKIILFNKMRNCNLHEVLSYEDAIQIVKELYSVSVIED